MKFLSKKNTDYERAKTRMIDDERKNKQLKEIARNAERIKKAGKEMEDLAEEHIRDGQPKAIVMVTLNLANTFKKMSAYMSVWKSLVSAGIGIDETIQMLNGNEQLIPTLNPNNIADLTNRVSTMHNRIKSFVDELNNSMAYDLEMSDEMTNQCEVAYTSLLAKYGATSEMVEIPSAENIFAQTPIAHKS